MRIVDLSARHALVTEASDGLEDVVMSGPDKGVHPVVANESQRVYLDHLEIGVGGYISLLTGDDADPASMHLRVTEENVACSRQESRGEKAVEEALVPPNQVIWRGVNFSVHT